MTTRPGYVWDATASEWVEIGQAAVVSPFKYQTSQPSSPATGDIWIDSDDDVPSVDSTLYYRWTKTMSGAETSLSGTDDNSLALKYTPGYESVFINGVLQVRGSDYVATTGTTVTGLTALTASDVVMVESIIAYSVGDTYTQAQINSLITALPKGLVAQVNSNTAFGTSSSTAVDITGMSVSFTGSTLRKYKATFTGAQLYGTAGERASFRITGTNISQSMFYYMQIPGANGIQLNGSVIFVASSNGTTTVKAQLARDIGSNPLTLYADSNSIMQLFVEDIGPA
jgi:hypothetical protein